MLDQQAHAVISDQLRLDGPTLSGPAAGFPDALGLQPAHEPIEWPRLSHELLTPLNGILGSIGVLVEGAAGPLSTQARACLGEAQLAGQHLNQRVRSLLLLIQALLSEPSANEARIDLLEASQIAMRKSGRPSRRFRTEPGGARFVVLGDPFWCEALARALVDLVAAAGPEGARVRADGDRLSAPLPDTDVEAATTLSLLLMDVVLRRHHGRLERSEGNRIELIWPADRIVTST